MLELLYIVSIILSKNVFKYLLKVSDNTFFDFFGNSFIDFYELTSKRFVLELINSTKNFFSRVNTEITPEIPSEIPLKII